MKREEKNALARQRILDAALLEFSEYGYEGASLNNVCAAYRISKGIIYHHFKDKDELYLLCVEVCFDALTRYLQDASQHLTGSAEERLRAYFDARLHFFANHLPYLGIFVDCASLPPAISEKVAVCRREFDALNVSVLTEFLQSHPLREGLSVDVIVEDFRSYMDFFNMKFRAALGKDRSSETVLREHEEQCHRQLDLLLYGAMKGENRAKQ